MKRLFKNILILFISFLFSLFEVFAQQWIPQISGTTISLRGVKAVNDYIVWVCGANGIVLRTTNGGIDWEIKTPTDTSVTNYSIDAINADTAWVTGTFGGIENFYIWKTTDGGTTWFQQYNNPNGFGNAIRFFNEKEGVCLADPDPYPSSYWEILITTNGGSNWTRVPRENIPSADSLRGEIGSIGSIDIVDNTIWFSSFYSISATPTKVYKSTDKGLTWTVSGYFQQQQGFAGSSYVAFANANNGVAVCNDRTVARTSDGGVSWTTSTVEFASFRSVVNLVGEIYIAVGRNLFGGCGWYSVGGSYWSFNPINTNSTLFGVDGTANSAWAVGNNGIILKWDGPPIPVELISFIASQLNSSVKLDWTTATELNNHGFEIQRKARNVEDFATVGFVRGHGTTTVNQSYSFIDENLIDGTYTYRLKQIDFNGNYSYFNEIEVDVRTLTDFTLEQNYPNPFNSSTTISWQSPVSGRVTIKLYDILGREIETIVDGYYEAGNHSTLFMLNSKLSTGVYFYKLKAGEYLKIKKMTLAK